MDNSELFGEVSDRRAYRTGQRATLEDRLFDALCALSSAIECQCGGALIANRERLDALEVIASAQSERVSRATHQQRQDGGEGK